MSENQNQGCIKCGHTEVEEGTLSATGSGSVSYTHLTLPTTPYV